MNLNDTIRYYNMHAGEFAAETLKVDFHVLQDRFLAALPEGGQILDLGCGAGRDTKYFLEKGYPVCAVDGSEELCRLASAYTGIRVRHQTFLSLDDVGRYDGVWACAALLHVPLPALPEVLGRIQTALKPQGAAYVSFKYGTFEGERNGRFFLDLTEERFAAVLQKVPGLKIADQYVTGDVRPGREEKWLNILLRKEG